jgi:hypothetical protein
MTDRELMQQARDALAGYRRELNEHQPCDAERALEARLAQPEREWQGLTDEEAAELCHAPIAVIEAKLKEKNAADA